MGRRAPTGRRVIRGKGWTRRTTIATGKYEVIAGAILRSLSTRPISFTELVRRVTARVSRFDGSVPWYTMSCLRELEVQGKVVRHRDPARYARA